MTRPAPSVHHGDHAHPPPHKKGRRSARRLSRLIQWEWGIVLALLSGLAVTVLVISQAPSDPKGDAEALVARMKAAAGGRSFAVIDKVPPKVCVMASWDLYRTGTITVNGVTPQRVSAAVLVDLCNQGEMATIKWSPKTEN